MLSNDFGAVDNYYEQLENDLINARSETSRAILTDHPTEERLAQLWRKEDESLNALVSYRLRRVILD